MNIEKMLCSISSNISDAMTIIDENEKGIVFLVDDRKKMKGILSDGDIRRALLNGYGLRDNVEHICNKDFVYSYETDDKKSIAEKFNHQIKIIPILDAEKHVVDCIEYDNDSHISLATPQLNGNEYKYLMNAFLTTWISSAGEYIAKFEKSFAEYCDVKHGVATSNGTTALHLALLALNIGSGDEVIVPNLTFAATINSVLYAGATPVIVDIEKDSWCIDPNEIEKAITQKTKAIIPVHLYGQPCDMGKIVQIAQNHNLHIIEDCAEAHGAEWSGRKVGSFSDISCFSFYGNKVITTGEGGMCLTNNGELEKKMRVLRDHGMSKERRYYHEVIGYNYRMTNMQAAIGTAQVEHIDDILNWRSSLEDTYREVFKNNNKIILQDYELPDRKKITWLVSVLVDENKRNKIIEALKSDGIDVRAFFVPLNEMDIYKKYSNSECTVSRKIAKMGLNLPTTYEMNKEKVNKVYNIISRIL